MSSLNPDQIAFILAEDAARQTRIRGRGPKVDITLDRTIMTWYKLQHHLCYRDCEHREQSPTDNACWNPECTDPRPRTDRGTNAVAPVAGVFMCRFCFLAGWKLPGSGT